MVDLMMKARDKFESEFEQMYTKIASEDKIPKDCVEIMKDLLKCIYYIDAIEGMASGFEDADDGYSRSYMPLYRRSYDMMPSNVGYSNRKRDSMGRFSRAGRSYDSGRRDAMNRLHEMMNSEPNEEVRMAIQSVIRELDG